jgi:hypothetical protein
MELQEQESRGGTKVPEVQTIEAKVKCRNVRVVIRRSGRKWSPEWHQKDPGGSRLARTKVEGLEWMPEKAQGWFRVRGNYMDMTLSQIRG